MLVFLDSYLYLYLLMLVSDMLVSVYLSLSHSLYVCQYSCLSASLLLFSPFMYLCVYVFINFLFFMLVLPE